MLIQAVFFALGLVILVVGAQRLVLGASALALRAGLSPLVVGLTVVAFGTSAPELAVSIKSALAGQADLSVGNIVGSNIFNILFILGLSALISPLIVSRQLIRLDVPVMVGVSLLFLLLSLDANVSTSEALLLLLGLAAYVGVLIRISMNERGATSAEEKAEAEKAKRQSIGVSFLWVAVGLLLLIVGSRLLVDAAVSIATVLGISEVVIGLTIVAIGTSLPEVATSVMATLKGERDIAVGNVVGSNIFNILGVGGVAGMVSPGGLPVKTGVVHFDLPVMVATAVACMPVFFTGRQIARWEGFVFLSYYVAYTAYLVMTATSHPFVGTFEDAMIWFVMPLTALTFVVVLARSLRARSIRRR